MHSISSRETAHEDLVTALALALLARSSRAGCAQVQAKAAFKDGNKAYKDENFKKAIDAATGARSSWTRTSPRPGSTWAAPTRPCTGPGKDSPENKASLDKAIEAYKKSLEVNTGETENQKTSSANTLAALTAIYADDPYKNYETAYELRRAAGPENPNDPKNLYAMANLYEKFEKVDDAERTYKQVAESNPNDAKACGALAALLQQAPLEGRAGDAPARSSTQAIAILERCAQPSTPTTPAATRRWPRFYWDKAYRDPLLNDEQKTRTPRRAWRPWTRR